MSRGHIELVHAPKIDERELPASGWPVQPMAKLLSTDSESGAFSGLIRLPAGYRRDPGHLQAETEWMIVDGTLRIGEHARSFGFYTYAPPSTTEEAWVTETGCTLLFFARDRRPDFIVGEGSEGRTARIESDTEQLPWMASPIPGPPEGNLLKILRHDTRTGEMVVLCSSVPQYDYPVLEFHDCVEEIYMLEGDIWLGNSGMMSAGSYFWRPPFITHGPFYSATGSLMLVWVPSTLVNHMPVNAASTPEQNTTAFVQAGGQRVVRELATG